MDLIIPTSCTVDYPGHFPLPVEVCRTHHRSDPGSSPEGTPKYVWTSAEASGSGAYPMAQPNCLAVAHTPVCEARPTPRNIRPRGVSEKLHGGGSWVATISPPKGRRRGRRPPGLLKRSPLGSGIYLSATAASLFTSASPQLDAPMRGPRRWNNPRPRPSAHTASAKQADARARSGGSASPIRPSISGISAQATCPKERGRVWGSTPLPTCARPGAGRSLLCGRWVCPHRQRRLSAPKPRTALAERRPWRKRTLAPTFSLWCPGTC